MRAKLRQRWGVVRFTSGGRLCTHSCVPVRQAAAKRAEEEREEAARRAAQEQEEAVFKTAKEAANARERIAARLIPTLQVCARMAKCIRICGAMACGFGFSYGGAACACPSCLILSVPLSGALVGWASRTGVCGCIVCSMCCSVVSAFSRTESIRAAHKYSHCAQAALLSAASSAGLGYDDIMRAAEWAGCVDLHFPSAACDFPQPF